MSSEARGQLVVGLGNPGPRYAGTRHNVGFEVVELLRVRWRARPLPARGAELFEAMGPAGRIFLLRPSTFMNRSGGPVEGALEALDLDRRAMLVVHDDLDLALGRIRLRPGGGSAGHRGVADIARVLGADDFARLRFGIGRPVERGVVDHVLAPFSADEVPVVEASRGRAADAAETWLAEGVQVAMNRYNAVVPTARCAPVETETDERATDRARERRGDHVTRRRRECDNSSPAHPPDETGAERPREPDASAGRSQEE